MSILITSSLITIFGLFNLLGIDKSYFFHQLVFFLIGLTIYFVIKKIGRNFFYLNTKFFYWIFIFFLIITFIIGLEAKGSKRWIELYFFNFQASETLKIFFIIFLADFFLIKDYAGETFSHFLSSLFYFLLPTLIIFKQPDLGNALVFAVIYLSMLLFSPIPKKYILYLLLFFSIVSPILWPFLKGYQKDRILSFINPHLDPQGTSYNMIQAMITVGSGKFFGKGMGLGTQTKLSFLPENHTDFAYASLVEQFGFFGGFITLLFYGLMIFLLVRRLLGYFISKDKENQKRFLILIGFVSYFSFQVFVNIGMNFGLLPIAGITLPFISYGGSSIVALMIGLGLIP